MIHETLPSGDVFLGDESICSILTNVSSPSSADGSSLVWVKAGNREIAEFLIAEQPAGLTVLDSSFSDMAMGISIKPGKAFVLANNPKLTFSKLYLSLIAPQNLDASGEESIIAETAAISEHASLGKGCKVGHHVVIGRAVLGNRVVVGAGTFIGDDVSIGNDVIIGANCSIGNSGFGYAKDDDGISYPFPHVGGVVINDGVEIGACTAIDRGALSDTVIGTRAKIDNLVHIAHNVQIGEDAYVIALSMLGGSSTVGARSWLAPSSVIKNGARVGADSVVGLASLVLRDVPDGEVWAGVPAKKIR